MSRYLRPGSIDEAVGLLSTDAALRIVAGGTDVYPSLGEAAARAAFLDIVRIPGLRGITRENEAWRIGAATTWSDVVRAPLPAFFDGLKLAGREVGAIQIQNAGTLAGNVVNASPAADGTVALMALDARVEIAGSDGRRVMPLGDFVTGVRSVALKPGEIVTALLVPDRPAKSRSSFLKLGARRYLVISIAMVSAVVDLDDAGMIAEAGIAVGACSPVARRLPALEARLVGVPPAQAADVVLASDADVLSPIDDVRARAGYRRDAAITLVRRTLAACAEAAR
ncbi:FAD binding domain-containing protein [Salinarimonas rosea]|uniref:FAD binding domain-containing protein n=1 Tax=Salinarimonas rosea TaxID=552063 RepID=UPI0004260EFB|nr:FAD binding domain-containing protein [Salinarimonas rosea]